MNNLAFSPFIWIPTAVVGMLIIGLSIKPDASIPSNPMSDPRGYQSAGDYRQPQAIQNAANEAATQQNRPPLEGASDQVMVAASAFSVPVNAQKPQRPHIFNIYASVPEGSGREVESTTAKIVELEKCGVAAINDHTFRYEGLAPNLMVTLTGPHRDMATAVAELRKAKACGVQGYTKRATFLGGE